MLYQLLAEEWLAKNKSIECEKYVSFGKVQGIDLENNKAVLFELNIENDRCIFPNTISDAIIDANKELKDLEDKLNETLETIRLLTPECDKLDYILSASSGAVYVE